MPTTPEQAGSVGEGRCRRARGGCGQVRRGAAVELTEITVFFYLPPRRDRGGCTHVFLQHGGHRACVKKKTRGRSVLSG
jgi:hypothetical protein